MWRPLIARDLGLLPHFVHNLKLYYLREMRFGVPLPMYHLKGDQPELYNRHELHLKPEKELSLYVSSYVTIKQGNIVREQIEQGVSTPEGDHDQEMGQYRGDRSR